MRSSIGAKIFGLAIVLLALNLFLAAFLLSEVTRLHSEIRLVAERDMPLDTALSELNDAGMRRQLSFEHLTEGIAAASPDEPAVAEAQQDFERDSAAIVRLLGTSSAILRDYPRRTADVAALEEIDVLVGQLKEEYPSAFVQERQMIDLLRAGESQRASVLKILIYDGMSRREARRERLEAVVDSLVLRKAQLASEDERRVFWLTIASTVALVLLGLVIARILTGRLVAPVLELLDGVRNVEKGDFSVQLPIRTVDEIGTLTKAFNVLVGELRSKEEMRRTFGKYIDPRILDQFILGPAATDPDGGRREMTVGFADLVGFSGLSEQLTPSGMVQLLNRHFSLQAEAIQRQRGIVDKFIGDAVMAFWGPPFTGEGEHAELACRAALLQIEAVAAFRKMLPELTGLRKNLPTVDARVGLNTGDVVVGNIGSENTRSYTVMGDAVNLASRLEGANRQYGTRILLSETTRERAGERIVTREIDLLTVKGKSETTRVFELLGMAGEIADPAVMLRDTFEHALAAYRGRDWARAEQGFRECLGLAPEDGPSRLFLERLQILQATPPPSDWNGVWHLDSK